MIRWSLVDKTPAPGGGELRLLKRGEEFSITIDGGELMNSRRGGSETALGAMTCERLQGRSAPRLLIGGLGMGFTLRAALAGLGPDAEVIVAEISPAVVAWAQGPLAELFGPVLLDPQVVVRVADVADLIGAGESYDAILLDVDSGPRALVREENEWLYSSAGLSAIRDALRPEGVLAIWSAAPDTAFVAKLRKADFEVTEAPVRSHGKGGARHVIWFATRGPLVSCNAPAAVHVRSRA